MADLAYLCRPGFTLRIRRSAMNFCRGPRSMSRGRYRIRPRLVLWPLNEQAPCAVEHEIPFFLIKSFIILSTRIINDEKYLFLNTIFSIKFTTNNLFVVNNITEYCELMWPPSTDRELIRLLPRHLDPHYSFSRSLNYSPIDGTFRLMDATIALKYFFRMSYNYFTCVYVHFD